jgi:hypothetical protein
LVRMVLVPATMALLGKANWWLPVWLDRLLPHVALEGTSHDGVCAHEVVATYRPVTGERTSHDEELVSH